MLFHSKVATALARSSSQTFLLRTSATNGLIFWNNLPCVVHSQHHNTSSRNASNSCSSSRLAIATEELVKDQQKMVATLESIDAKLNGNLETMKVEGKMKRLEFALWYVKNDYFIYRKELMKSILFSFCEGYYLGCASERHRSGVKLQIYELTGQWLRIRERGEDYYIYYS